jgi:iron(II)-dependent oxidoreductase
MLVDPALDPLLEPQTLARDLMASRARSSRVTAGLGGARLLGPKLAIVNPPLWEIGHVAWFQERWCLRTGPAGEFAESMLEGADALYDSSAVAHDARWDLPLPDLAATRAYAESVLEAVLERLGREPQNTALRYFVRLATLHEDMHAEAFHYTRHTLGYEDPFPAEPWFPAAPAAEPGDAECAGGVFELGARPGSGFVFDNEKWAHEVRVAPFRIARAPVTNAQFLEYVEAGGKPPRDWRREGGAWRQRRFDRWRPLAPHEPVVNLSWDEAQEWCRWAGRRLPSEAEWAFAAASGAFAPRERTGRVWEWTESSFAPYPGFSPDPYRDYSQPWFGSHKVLRGGSFAAPARVAREGFRNFYTPDRGDIFAGFRSCAVER